ncbi:hypothetical protein KY329_04870 [Candidatus Woesearchaeota archaeon]|nr:hypothetical protein [Candidatus Woesearchaeota archaeon]
MNFLKSKERKQFVNAIEKQWGSCPELIRTHCLVRSGKDRIYLVNTEYDTVDLNGIRINNVGLYIAEQKGELRLSIEGSQLVGPQATKNVLEIDDELRKQWFMGEDLHINKEFEGFVILKHGKDYIGSGKFKEGKILNFVPKTRRLAETH